MSLGLWFSRLPPQLSRRLYPALRYTNLMRAVEMRHSAPWTRDVQGWRVLDVGCGHGFYSLAFARGGAHLLGCDLSRPALHDAHQTAQGMGLAARAAYLVADGSKLPVPDETFDLIVCNCVLEHVVDDHGALAGMHRALRPGGLLYLTVDSAEHDLALGFLERLPPKAKGILLRSQIAAAPTVAQGLDDYLAHIYHVQRRYHQGELAAELEELGFDVVDWRSYLSRLGAVHYEAFHLFRGLDTQRGLGRLAYMISSLILYPLAVLVDSSQQERGYGLALVVRKRSAPLP
jgi:ubiquinone/menaquinone biosynthesis C-methylase UbiE